MLKVATILAKADCIRYFLETAILSDSEINSFNAICNTIHSEYEQMIEDKNRSTNTKAKIKRISNSTNEEHKKLKHDPLSSHTEQAREIIQGKIDAKS